MCVIIELNGDNKTSHLQLHVSFFFFSFPINNPDRSQILHNHLDARPLYLPFCALSTLMRGAHDLSPFPSLAIYCTYHQISPGACQGMGAQRCRCFARGHATGVMPLVKTLGGCLFTSGYHEKLINTPAPGDCMEGPKYRNHVLLFATHAPSPCFRLQVR
jgi:hypothetical protein